MKKTFFILLSAVLLASCSMGEQNADILMDAGQNKADDLTEDITSNIQDKQSQESVYIENGDVYYINESGEEEIIASSTDDEENIANIKSYEKAELSPNNEFIMLGSKGWEHVFVEVYEIESDAIYDTEESGSEYGEWLPDNRLRIVGECGMGISCGIFESIDSEKPWNMRKMSDVDYELETYKNEEYGYSIQYDDSLVQITDQVFERGTKGNPSFRINSGGHFALGVWGNPEGLTPVEWMKDRSAVAEWPADFEEMTVNGEKAYKTFVNSMEGGTSCHIEWVIMPKTGRFYTFGLEICGDDKSGSLKTFHDIVSSFSINSL